MSLLRREAMRLLRHNHEMGTPLHFRRCFRSPGARTDQNSSLGTTLHSSWLYPHVSQAFLSVVCAYELKFDFISLNLFVNLGRPTRILK